MYLLYAQYFLNSLRLHQNAGMFCQRTRNPPVSYMFTQALKETFTLCSLMLCSHYKRQSNSITSYIINNIQYHAGCLTKHDFHISFFNIMVILSTTVLLHPRCEHSITVCWPHGSQASVSEV